AYVSIRVGDHRRQAAFKPKDVFHFPAAVGAKSVSVDIFQKLGSTQVSLAGLSKSGSLEDTVKITGFDGSQINMAV
ncbi:unnamed protein product, partial [Polarella glacialis]